MTTEETDEKEFEETWEMNKDGLARHPGDKFIAKWYFMESRRLLREQLGKWHDVEEFYKETE